MLTSNLGFVYGEELMTPTFSTTKTIGTGYDAQAKGEIFRPAHKADKLKIILEDNDKESESENILLVEGEQYEYQSQSSEVKLNSEINSIDSAINNIVGILGQLLRNPMDGYLSGMLDYWISELIRWADKLFRRIFEGYVKKNGYKKGGSNEKQGVIAKKS